MYTDFEYWANDNHWLFIKSTPNGVGKIEHWITNTGEKIHVYFSNNIIIDIVKSNMLAHPRCKMRKHPLPKAECPTRKNRRI